MILSADEIRKVDEAYSDGRVICRQCGATWATYDKACNAPLDVACEGFNAVEFAAGYAPFPNGFRP